VKVDYDESVIQQFAERLYKRASTIVLTYAFLGLLLGAGGAIPVVAMFGSHGSNSVNVLYVVLGLIGFAIGWALGTERAFALRLMAQTALCQAQIERNTRGTASAVAR
jgi:uncharacterized membrane protein HdeD (DUF308 family)